jgi:hypothetical protein
MIRELMDSLPLWGALLVTIGLVLASNELGYRLGTFRRDTQEKDAPPQVVSMTGAHVGLLAFILAFSFSLAAGHFGDRKQLLLEEVNAIETAYLRAELIDAPQGGNIRSLLAEYSATRATLSTPDTITGVIKKSQVIQGKIWAEIKVIAGKEKLDVLDSLLVQAVNNVFDLHEKRVFAGLHSRIPPNIWVTLYVVLILSMLGMGFSAGLAAKRSPVASLALALSFSMVMFVIADLDRPTSGVMRNDQTIMVNLSQRLNPTNE